MQATWFCKSCSYENYASRKKCSRCFKPNIVKQVETKKPKVDKNDPDSVPRNWQQIVDPSSQQPYYYNSVSKNTTWTRPECLMAMSRKVLPPKNQEQLMQEYLKRPARKQVDKDEMGVVEGLHEKNIYFDKFLTFEKDDGTVDPAETRCVISRDAGYTKADKAKQNNKTCFCIHFARGACAHGKECNYYHRIPMTNDMRWIDEFHDVFGRKRHKAKREDMRGVGSFEEECKSLFVTGLKYIPNYDVISVLKIHFGEWGPVERVFPIQKQAAAVVRFRTRYHAEFAKVAMTGQELDKKEVVGIRWAYEDKNVKGLEMKDAANERESEQKEIQKELQRIQQLKRKAELNRQQQQNELQQQENEMQQQQYQQYQQHQQQLQQDSDINKSEVEVEEGIEPPGNDENDSEEEDQGIAPPGSEQAAMISAAEEQRKREVEGVVLISKDAKAKLDANTQLLVDKGIISMPKLKNSKRSTPSFGSSGAPERKRPRAPPNAPFNRIVPPSGPPSSDASNKFKPVVRPPLILPNMPQPRPNIPPMGGFPRPLGIPGMPFSGIPRPPMMPGMPGIPGMPGVTRLPTPRPTKG